MRVRRMMRERARVWCQAINIDHANEFTKNIPINQNFNFNLNFKGRIFQENKSRREKKMKTRKMKKKKMEEELKIRNTTQEKELSTTYYQDQDQRQFEPSKLRNGVFTFIESYISSFITISQCMIYRNL